MITDENVTFMTLNDAGAGTIQAGPMQQERLEEFTNRVGSGEFHCTTLGSIPTKCIDGRCGGHGEPMPNSAGGTETLMVADDLTTKNFDLNGEASTREEYEALLDYLLAKEYVVGGHTAQDLHGAPSGCGANDKLGLIYEYIAQNGDTLRNVTESLGYDISDADHALIIGNAAKRHDFSGGDALLATLREKGDEQSVDVLRGAHTEVMAVINRRGGTTLDRDAVEAEFGDQYEAFNVDEWSFQAGAEAISQEGAQDEVRQKRIAMMYYNLATAGVLCGPDMRVVVLA